MVTDINLEGYLKERLILSKDILSLLKNRKEDIDSLEEVVEESGRLIEELKEVTLKLSIYDVEDINDPLYERNLKLILEENKLLVSQIEVEKKKLLENMKQTNKANEIRDSYVAQDIKPMFVDKDL